MSLFRSLHSRFEQETDQQAGSVRQWPATYRGPLPTVNLSDYNFQVRIEKQLPKNMPLKQLASLPSFTESRRITSKSGWTYYGQWKGITFQTLFTMFTTPALYPWVKLEMLNGEHAIIDRASLMNYRILTECDGQPLSVMYGGPLLVHNFDYYIEYSLPYVKSVILMQGDYQYTHPNEVNGFTLDQARVTPGDYYAIHHEKISHL